MKLLFVILIFKLSFLGAVIEPVKSYSDFINSKIKECKIKYKKKDEIEKCIKFYKLRLVKDVLG